MIRKSLSLVCLLATIACPPGADGPDVDLAVIAQGETSLTFDGAPSPDGTRIAYASQIEGKSAIYVAAVDGSKPVRLTHGIWDVGPIWSPDGRWIAYYSDDNADVWLVPSAGGEARPLTTGPALDNPGGWVADGGGVILLRRGVGDDQTLVAPLDGGPVRPLFAAPAGNVTAHPSPDGAKVAFLLRRAGRTTLWLQDAVGGAPRQLTTEGLEGARLERMWSPDGGFLLYTSRRTGTSDLWVASVATGELRQLTQDIRNDGGGSWSPDGRWVVFQSDRGGQWDLWVVAAEGGEPRRITASLALESAPHWSPDGEAIMFTSATLAASVDALPADGGPTRTLVSFDGYSVSSVALSPNGQTALFVSDRSGDVDIWSVPVTGGEPRQVAASPTPDQNPAWSPDGRQVAFESSRAGTADLWLTPADGDTARHLTDWPSSELGAQWSPDGATIAFASTRDATQAEVWTIPAVGGAATRITRTNASAARVRWSPDGRTLFYVGATADGARQLFRVPAGGGSPRQLTHVGGGASIGDIEISPDGAHVAYVNLVAGFAFLEVIPAAGGPARRLTDSTRAYQIDPAWSPDGSRIAAVDWNYSTDHYNLMTVAFPEGVDRRLTATTDVFEFSPRWTPDGKTLVYSGQRSTSRVMSANVGRLLAPTR